MMPRRRGDRPQIRNRWPEYRKNLGSFELRAKFDGIVVARAAAMLPELCAFLDLIGLVD